MKKILLIDDDQEDADILQDALAEVSHDIDFSWHPGSEDILRSMGKLGSLPDIIFLDINLGAIKGWEYLKDFKSNPELQHIPVIIYTTSSRVEERQIAGKLGAAGFIVKPWNYQSLIDLLIPIVHPLS